MKDPRVAEYAKAERLATAANESLSEALRGWRDEGVQDVTTAITVAAAAATGTLAQVHATLATVDRDVATGRIAVADVFAQDLPVGGFQSAEDAIRALAPLTRREAAIMRVLDTNEDGDCKCRDDMRIHLCGSPGCAHA